MLRCCNKYVLKFVFYVCTMFLYATDSSASMFVFDAELNDVMGDLTKPLFRAAGIPQSKVEILVINDPRINAYTTGNKIVVYAGLLMFDEYDPEPLISILAHEIAHVASSHTSGVESMILEGNIKALTGAFVGVITTLATKDSRALLVSAGINNIFQESMLNYSREQEKIADQLALKYLAEIGYNGRGLKRVLSYIRSDNDLLHAYSTTHPLSTDRIRAVVAHMLANNINTNSVITDAQIKKYRRAVHKLKSLLSDNYKPDNLLSADLSRYISALMSYKQGKTDQALRYVDELLTVNADDAYYNELKGGVLARAGRLKEAIPFYENAVLQSGEDILMVIDASNVMFELDDPSLYTRAIEYLKGHVHKTDSLYIEGVFLGLSKGYFLLGMYDKSYMFLLERALKFGLIDDAKSYAKLASSYIRSGSSEESRLHDIESYLAKVR